MEKFVLVIHILASVAVIGLVLLQHGKGADMGATFGSGASGSLFGVSGSSNFLSRLTAIFITVFFATSLALAYIASHKAGETSVIKMQAQKAKAEKMAPASKSVPKDVPTPIEPSAKDVPN